MRELTLFLMGIHIRRIHCGLRRPTETKQIGLQRVEDGRVEAKLG